MRSALPVLRLPIVFILSSVLEAIPALILTQSLLIRAPSGIFSISIRKRKEYFLVLGDPEVRSFPQAR